MSERPRILVFTGSETERGVLPPSLAETCELVAVHNVAEALAALRAGKFDGLFASTQEPIGIARVRSFLRSDTILEVIDDGVAMLGPDLRILWANATFEKWCSGLSVGRVFYEALGSPAVVGPNVAPFEMALQGKSTQARLQFSDNRILELRITPLIDPSGQVQQFVTVCHDITFQVTQQQILDKLHQAANQLGNLDAAQLAEMSVEERVELLKYNIRKLTHDLLHYDVVEVRLLDQDSGRLEPLLAEGMLDEAARRVLYASVEGNGVTGFVAATGQTYICRDVSCDPHYISGAQGARSSLTVAMKWNNKVIGTFNVESPKPDGFTEQDVQFTEIFCGELASALHTLELLRVEKRGTMMQISEAMAREVALPVDDILAAATSVLDRWIGHEPEMEEKLRTVLERARAIKQSIQNVGQDLYPQGRVTAAGPETPGRLRGRRILVADNDERVRRSAHSLLGRLGAVVETARDGREAVTMAKLSPYDAMVADIRLPDMSGYDVFHQLRQARPGARVILMTAFGYDPSHAIVKARQEGLHFVLYKPFRVEQMLSALESPDAQSGLRDRTG